MNHAIGLFGGLLACVAAALAVDATTRLLHRLAERSGNPNAPRVLRCVLAVVIGVLVGEGLPLLWPELVPLRAVALGAGIGLAFGAIRIGGSMRIRHGQVNSSREAP